MRMVQQGGKTYRLPSLLNEFQERMYIHLIEWKRKHITEVSGTARRSANDAILPDEVAEQRPQIYPSIRRNLEEHLQRFPFRIHKYFNHMASSQAANINLFLPILKHRSATAILRELKPDFVRLATEKLDCGYRIEFWDEDHGCLNDKTPVSGTDTDLAIAYFNHQGNLCLWLIEHKLTEAEFTQCGGFKSKGRQAQHDCEKSFGQLLEDPSACYYHDVNKFNYWNITAANREFFPSHVDHIHCPFRGGMNQLWRNQLMALAIEQKRDPYQYASFSVVRHPRNNALNKTLRNYQALIGDNPKFTIFTSAQVIAAAESHADDGLREWINWYRDLYDV